MSYEAISIRDAISSINKTHNGWYLPQVQRQYVWGLRYESESYICLLLDSIYRGYPIGGMVLWETDAEVPHREFLRDFEPGLFAAKVDQGLWSRHKSLIYYGQQRLQTLFSVLCHTFNGRVLCFNLRFDPTTTESDETGFFFIDKDKETPLGSIRMNSLFNCEKDDKQEERLKDFYAKQCDYSENEQLQIKCNLGQLWKIFVESDKKTIAYFPVRSKNNREVNKIFRRLNTGGIPLTQIELVLSKIKEQHSGFEEELYKLSDEVQSITHGFEFSPTEILQFIYLMIYGTPNISSDRVTREDIDKFNNILVNTSTTIKAFFEDYLWGLFKINDGTIIPRRLAMLLIIAYFVESKTKVKHMPDNDIKPVHQYFILSQINDWNTQTMISNFYRKVVDASKSGKPFPLDDVKKIAVEKNRYDDLRDQAFLWQPWFALKILAPSRVYIFSGTKPQVDHIFPIRLADMDQAYQKQVDILWNLQPMPADVNNYKRAKHPHDFFRSPEGSKYVGDYDYIPPISSRRWLDYRRFLKYRRVKMLQMLKKKYGLKLISS